MNARLKTERGTDWLPAAESSADRALFEHVPVGIYRSTPTGRLLAANPTLVAMLGYPSHEALLMTNTVEMYVDPADRQRWREIMERDGVVTEFDTQKRRLDGTVIWLRDSARVVRDDEDRVLYYEGAVVDITAQKIAEEQLRRSEARFRALVESSPDSMLRVDRSGKCVDAAAGRSMLVVPDEAIGRVVTDLFSPAVAGRFLEEIGRVLDTGSRVTFEYAHPGGGAHEARVSVAGRDDVLILIRDVGESRRMRAHLARSDRLAAVGLLAAGVAHEVNNPLSYVRANLEYLRETVEDLLAGEHVADEARKHEARDAVIEAIDGVVRVGRIVEELRDFSRMEDEPSVEPDPTGSSAHGVELRRVVQSAIKLVSNQIRHRAALTVTLPDLPSVHASASRLGQVFVNLLVNAAQSIEDGGADCNEIRVSARTSGGDRVVVEIADTGAGIEPAVLERIFDPFFTTKAAGVGTGLGLAVCHQIVSSFGGAIEVESRVGEGTVLRVYLCIARAPAAPSSPLPPRPTAAVRARVLIVDDEPLIGRALKRELSRTHDVAVVTEAREALARVRDGERWDTIFCDMMMPVMSGMDLYQELQEIDLDQARRVVFVTGGAFTERARAFLQSTDNPVLQKPVTTHELRALVASLASRA